MFKRLTLAAAFSAALFAPLAANADVDTSGETVEFWIPFKEGGGTDAWARVLAPLIAEKLPGQPTLVVKNNTQGGGIGGANEFHRRMEADGTMIFGTSGSIQVPFLLKDPRVRYDYADWTPILATPAGGVVYIPASMEVADASEIAKLADHDLRYGSQGIATLDLVPLLAFEMLGLDVEAVFGMKSRSIARQSIQRGEVTIDYQTTPSYLKHVTPLVEAGEMVPLFSWGALDEDGNIVRDPTFPDLPTFAEVYEQVHGAAPSGPDWDAWKAFFVAGFGSQKMVMLPAETPQEIVTAYREAMVELANDPAARETLEGQIGVYPPISGDALEATKTAATTVPPEAEAWVTEWLRERYNFSN